MDTKRRLFVGGHMNGQVMAVPNDHHNIVTVEYGDEPDTEATQVTYSRKPFIAGYTRIDVYVRHYNVTPGEVLTALALAAGIDTDHSSEPLPPDPIHEAPTPIDRTPHPIRPTL